ncbi:MAG: transposase [Acetobacteraceae bacterium]|nr:transposase [Acetobacteraceae bacterium]
MAGGLSTKIHALVDALGNPLRLLLTPGQAHDLAGADALLPHMTANLLIADRAFDADSRVLDRLAAAGKSAVIPPRPNRFESWICWLKAAQADGVEAKSSRLGPHVGCLMKAGVGVEIGVAIETGNTEALVLYLAVLGLIELLLRERGQQQPQAFNLYRRDKADHHFVVVLDRQQPAARHIAQFGMRREKDRRWKFRRNRVGKIEIDVETL